MRTGLRNRVASDQRTRWDSTPHPLPSRTAGLARRSQHNARVSLMKQFIRNGNRKCDALRRWKIIPGVSEHAEGSALIEAGKTRVLCTASIEDKVPSFLKNTGKGWVTAEYSMLPRATHTRSPRERGGRIGGRTMEIQRIIGRSLRSVCNLEGFGERTVTVDCDVIQADGGTRVAAVSAAWVALHMAFETLVSGKTNSVKSFIGFGRGSQRGHCEGQPASRPGL